MRLPYKSHRSKPPIGELDGLADSEFSHGTRHIGLCSQQDSVDAQVISSQVGGLEYVLLLVLELNVDVVFAFVEKGDATPRRQN